MILFLLLKITSLLILCRTQETDISDSASVNCRERNRLINSDKADLFKIADARVGYRLVLQCHYCKENDDVEPKIWYRYGVNFTYKEVDLGMDSKSNLNRLRVNEAHSLIFQRILPDDFNFYFCQGTEQQDADNRFNYLVDVVYESKSVAAKGNLTDWRKYHDEYLIPVNRQLSNPDSELHRELQRRYLNEISLELYTEWDDAWGICEVCDRPKGDGIRRKNGPCRLKITKENRDNSSFFSVSKSWDEAIFFNAQRLSCRSLLIYRIFPQIARVIKDLPDFIQIEHCEGECSSDAQLKGWKTGKTLGFKYKITYVLAEGAHLTLICPDSSLRNEVRWKQNGRELKPGVSKTAEEAKVTVDSFYTLYLREVTSAEEGNYTCEVDGARMQQVTIFVASKSRLLTQAFVRHVIYLSFVLSLTFSCYCCGLCITWRKRDTFKSYEELRHIKQFSSEDSD